MRQLMVGHVQRWQLTVVGNLSVTVLFRRRGEGLQELNVGVSASGAEHFKRGGGAPVTSNAMVHVSKRRAASVTTICLPCCSTV